jgi:cytochrome c oxidase assembly protein subunit 15
MLQQFTQPIWIRRLAIVICCATLPLIFIGGLVTTTDAGMAVPDWPNTYGYNMFLYPWTTWIAGPWDLFVEHGHRLLAASLGMLCILMCVVACKSRLSPLFKWLTVVTLLMVIGQGILGGQRVNFDARFLAMLHGITGPIVFALTMIQVAAINSELRPAETIPSSLTRSKPRLFPLAALTTLLAYGQLLLGAQLRHGIEWLSAHQFRALGIFHMIGASVITLAIVILFFTARRSTPALKSNSRWLLAMIVMQLVFGTATWLVNFGWPLNYDNMPVILRDFISANPTARSMSQTLTTTTHVALGSLILGTSSAMAFISWRTRRTVAATEQRQPITTAKHESAVLRTLSAEVPAGGLA